MQIFIDSVNISDIKETLSYGGIVSGITTNPSIVVKNMGNEEPNSFVDFVDELYSTFPNGEISVEVTEVEYVKIIEQGKRIFDRWENIVLKLPCTRDGIKACSFFSSEDKKINMTLCFSLNQAIVCALAGATYTSVFIGRSEDVGFDGLDLVRRVMDSYKEYGYPSKVLACSIRNLHHIDCCANIGVDVVTISPAMFYAMIDSKMSIDGANKFMEDFNKSGLIL